MQCGSLGILGYYLLFVHPRIMKENAETLIQVTEIMSKNSKEDRSEFMKRNGELINVLNMHSQKIDNMVEVLHRSIIVRADNVQIVTKSDTP